MLIMSLICVKFVYIDAKSLIVVLKKFRTRDRSVFRRLYYEV